MDTFSNSNKIRNVKIDFLVQVPNRRKKFEKKTVMSIKSSMISDNDLKIQFFNFDMSPSMRCLVL